MKLKKIGILIVTLTLSTHSQAWFGAKKDENILNLKETQSVTLAKTEALKTLQSEMSEKFNQIEDELKLGNSGTALAMAKNVLDLVKIKTGIDPKNKITERFLIPTIFPEDSIALFHLSDEQKELVIRTVSDYRGGLYLDIINLSKRTTLLYLKALEAELLKKGGLTNEDKDKILKDLVKASIIPITLEDKKKKRIIIFDEDVANEDHIYLFNRELKMYLIHESSLLISESKLEEEKRYFKAQFFKDYISKEEAIYKDAINCVEDAYKISDWSAENSAVARCFYKYSSKVKDAGKCYHLADKALYNKTRARLENICAQRFN